MANHRLLTMISAAAVCVSAISCSKDVEEWNGNGNGGSKPKPEMVIDWKSRAKETYLSIVRNYRIGTGAASGLFKENYPASSGDGLASFLWPYDGMVSGIAALNRLGEDVGYVNAVENFQKYYRTYGAVAVGGYGSSTDGNNGGGDRFYDDNSIVGIELVEAYRQTKDTKYLDRCAQIVKFLHSGRDDTFGGALWWNESYRNVPGNDSSNKPACANGFATWFLLSYYEFCPQSEKKQVLDMAKDFYGWLYENLRDPMDNVYWNSKGADGVINKTKWTYNSGAMIASGLRLYKITGEAKYLQQAKDTADGAYKNFVRNNNDLFCYPTHDPWFTVQLIKSYIELEPEHTPCTSYIKTFVSYADYAWKHARGQNGLFYEDWSGRNPNLERDKSLLMQAAALESFAVIALYTGE